MSMVPIRLRIFSPAQIVLGSTMMYALMLVASPVSFRDVASYYSASVLLGFYLCALSGMFIGCRRLRAWTADIPINLMRVSRLKWWLVLLGGIGMCFRFYDRVFSRAGGAATGDFVANRQLLEGGVGNGPIGMIGAMLAPLLFFLPIAIFLSRAAGIRRTSDYPLVLYSSVYCLLDVIFFGSRSSALVFIAIMVVIQATLGLRRLRPKVIVAAIFGFFAFMWLSGAILWSRTTQMGLNPIQSLRTSAPGHMVAVDHDILVALGTPDTSGLHGLVYAYLSFCQYTLHGMFEFMYAVDHFEQNYSYGLQTFYIPAKVVWKIANIHGNIEDTIIKTIVRPGVYTTFFGPIFYDYGAFFGLIACGILGFLSGRLARRLGNGSIHLIVLYVLVTALLPFTLIANLFTGGTGQCLMIDAIALMLVLKSKWFRMYAADLV